MGKITLSISPLPPFVGLSVDLSIDRIARGMFRKSDSPLLAGKLIAECLGQIMDDQFEEGDAKGAWSKRYPEYLRFIWGKEEIPNDIAVRETITYSTWIAIALIRYSKLLPEKAVSRGILPRLQVYADYLKRHHDAKTGGFGLSTRPKSRGSSGIATDLRHSVWAALALWKLPFSDSKIADILHNVGGYIFGELQRLDFNNERAITCATLHKFLTTEGIREVAIPQISRRVGFIKRIESVIVERFDPSYGSWDIDRDIPKTAGIDNALFVLTCLNDRAYVDKDCVEVIQTAIKRLLGCLVSIDKEKLGLPFYDGGPPDIGASLQLLWIVRKNRGVLDVEEKTIKQLLNFVIDPSTRGTYSSFAYPWHLASALYLSTESG